MKEAQTMPEISEVQITFIKPQNGLIGFASFVLGGGVYLSSVGIHSKRDGSGYRLTYPTRKAGSNQTSLFHPINKPTAYGIEQAVMAKLNEVMDKCNDRHCGTNDGKHAVSY